MLSAALRLGLALSLLVPPAFGAAATPASAPALARLTYVEHKVEKMSAGPWLDAKEGEPLRIGEQVRTAPDAALQIDFPWMAVSVGPSSDLQFPDGPFLQGVLGQGRVVLRAERREILKLLTGEAEVRGRGRVVVRRQDDATWISSLTGAFSVEGKGSVTNVPAGTGTIVRAGEPPVAATSLPAPPDGLVPGADPFYAPPGQSIRLRWNGRAAHYHVEVLAVGSETVLVEREVDGPSAELTLRWPGAFRWRVASRDERGLEGPPSHDGFFCVDE